MTNLSGHCHCGAIHVHLETAKPAADLPLRACQCSFCTRHGGLTTADPQGWLHIEAAPGSVVRYTFGLGITDFILCAECGTYVAALMEDEAGLTGVVNVRGAAMPGFEGRTPEPLVYDDESPDTRRKRRRERWMPATLVETQPNA